MQMLPPRVEALNERVIPNFKTWQPGLGLSFSRSAFKAPAQRNMLCRWLTQWRFGHIVENSSGMDTLLSQAFRENPPSIGQKWSLVLYCDELVLGNALRHQNNRILQVFYWSWLQLGSRALASEKCWFPVAVIRSTKVAELGGVTVVWPQILDPWKCLWMIFSLISCVMFWCHWFMYIYI